MIAGMSIAVGVWLNLQGPDYIDFQAKADSLARALTSVASCRTLGFDVPQVDHEAAAKAIVADAAREGISADLAGAFIQNAVADETARLATLNEVATNQNNQDAGPINRHISWWAQRCEMLAEDVIGRRFVRRAPAAEAAAQADLIGRLEAVYANKLGR